MWRFAASSSNPRILSFLLQKNKNVIHQPRSVRIWKNCARGLGYRPRAVLKTEGTVFPNMDRPRLVNDIFVFFYNTMKAVRKTQTFRAVIRARFATNWTISSEQIVIKREILYSKLKKEVSPKDFYFCNNIGHSKVFQTNLKHFLAITTQQARIPPTKSGPDGKMLLAPRTNQIAGFVEFHLLTHWEKNKVSLSSLALMYYSLKWPGSIENSTGKRKKTCTLFCCSKTLVLVFLKT